MFFVPN